MCDRNVARDSGDVNSDFERSVALSAWNAFTEWRSRNGSNACLGRVFGDAFLAGYRLAMSHPRLRICSGCGALCRSGICDECVAAVNPEGA